MGPVIARMSVDGVSTTRVCDNGCVESSLDGSSDPPRNGPKVGASRARVLRALRGSPEGRGVRELAAELGLHVNTIRFHLDWLVSERMVTREVEERTEPGRPRLVFTAVPGGGVDSEQRSYRLLATVLASFISGSVPDASTGATHAGQVWGHYLTQGPAPYRSTDEQESITELLRILDELGFAPEQAGAESGPEIRLRNCPFLEVAEEHRDIACAVHLGLMRGALEEMRAPVTVERLDPFVEPSLCVARLGPAGGVEKPLAR